jgi:hypothetical protein
MRDSRTFRELLAPGYCTKTFLTINILWPVSWKQ